MLTNIPLESSLQRLSINVIKHGGSTVKLYTNFISLLVRADIEAPFLVPLKY
jgi:hypothetical protein